MMPSGTERRSVMMTLEELYRIRSQILLKSHESLVELALNLADEFIGEVTLRMAREQSEPAMSAEYRRVREERDAYKAENETLREALKKTAEESRKKANALFGRRTEKTDDLLNNAFDGEEVDEAEQEDDPAGSGPSDDTGKGVRLRNGSYRRKRKGKRQEDLDRLRHETRFVVDFERMDTLFGAGNYRIAYWRSSTSVEHTKPEVYALDRWTPVVSVGLEHDLYTVDGPPKLIPRSLLSASLATEIIYQKFFLLLPFYRIESYFAGIGYPIARQLMSGWIIRLAYDYFYLLYDYMKARLMEEYYHQCDETTLRVIHDGRRAGAKSYLWVHSTSELLECPPIILFCYELTRGTDHLREFYKDFSGFITCDAYCAYQTFEKEKNGLVRTCGCLMHARRRFADALRLADKSGLTAAQIEDLPETRALLLIGKIFDADGELKALPLEKREELRDTKVRPLVEEFYAFLEGIDLSDPALSYCMRDAVSYSLNQKERLCRFLEDGNIPVDNGSSERHIRALATARRSFLHCNTIDGATALAIMFSIVETAKANGADVRCYLSYVLEQLPGHMDDTDRSFLSAMMPWSEEYREYEKAAKSGPPPGLGPNEYLEKPRPSSWKKKTA